MESFFVNLGLSYTWSKALPYILLVVLGIVLGLFLFKKLQSKVGKLLALLLMVIPFTVYFIFYPIYEGDFTNEARIVQHSDKTQELQGKKLIVISLPGCPFCKQSVLFFKEIKKKHPHLKVEYVVTSDDDRNLAYYDEVIQGAFPLRLANNPEAMSKLAQGSFPTYVLVDNNQPLKIWSNNTFGVMALDDVVDSFKK